MIYEPHDYQTHAEKHIINNAAAGLFMEMGLGKTVVTLSAIDKLIYEDMEIRKVLVIAPKTVAETVWTDEIYKWDHLKHLRVSLVLGEQKDRLAALHMKADIYVINRENVAWLVTHYMTAWPFDMIIIDELSSFKNPQSKRFKALRMVRPLTKRVVGLTGTPSPNGLPDLWAQVYLLDMGVRLGKTIGQYRSDYLKVLKANGPVVYKYGIKDDAAKELIYDKIGDICISMRQKDYLQMPERIEQLHKVKLPREVMHQYEELEDKEVLKIIEIDKVITAANAAALMTKLLQFANGAIYLPEAYDPLTEKKLPREWVHIHNYKMDALGEIIEAAQGQPVLVFYQFQHDLERMQALYGAKHYDGPADYEAWNRGEIELLAAHPLSIAYGLNMQAGGCIIVWFGVPFSLELWEQGNSRLHRQGQLKPVFLHKLCCPATADMDTVSAIARKKEGQDALMDAVAAKVDRVKKKYNLN